MSSTVDILKAQFSDLKWVPLPPPDKHPMFNYSEFKPNTTDVLPVGHRREPKYRAFGVETYYHRDIPVKMRDGVILYKDIFRAKTSDDEPVPTIIPYSTYGKTGTGDQMDPDGFWRRFMADPLSSYPPI